MAPRSTRITEDQNQSERLHHVECRLIEARGVTEGGHRIFGVQIINAGLSKNLVNYPLAVLHEAVSLYSGVQVYDHHRTDQEMQTGSVAGIIGQIVEPTANSAGIEAELHLLPSAVAVGEAFDRSLEGQARGEGPLIGLSHDVSGDIPRVPGTDQREAQKLHLVHSVDVVARPSAGGQATRQVAGEPVHTIQNPEEGTMTLQELLEALAKADAATRAKLLEDNKSVLETNKVTAEAILGMADGKKDPEEKPEAKADPTGDVKPAEVAAGEPANEPVSVGASETRHTGRVGDMLIREAVSDAKLPDGIAVNIREGLNADGFTDAELDVEVKKAQSLREAWDAAQQSPSIPHVRVTEDQHDKLLEKLERTLEGLEFGKNYEGFRGWGEMVHAFNPEVDPFNIDYRDVVREMKRYQGSDRVSESLDSTTFSTALGNTLHRMLMKSYNQYDLIWQDIVSTLSAPTDFKEQKRERIGGFGLLSVVAESAAYPGLTNGSEEEATFTVGKRGGTQDVTWESMKNDDLGVLRRIPTEMARSAALTLNAFVWNMLLANGVTTYDAVALFAAGHSNTVVTALSDASLEAGIIAMMSQTRPLTPATDYIDVVPKLLLVAPQNHRTAHKLTMSQVDPGSADDSNQPNYFKEFALEARSCPEMLADNDEWFLVADPKRTDTIEMGFLDGQQTPQLFVNDDPAQGAVFSNDVITYKIRHVYSGAVLDHRGFYRGKPA